ncbi:hypothetical protein ACT7C7_00205 [Bacillus cereus]
MACCSPFTLVFSSSSSISSGGAISCKNSWIPCSIRCKSASFLLLLFFIHFHRRKFIFYMFVQMRSITRT